MNKKTGEKKDMTVLHTELRFNLCICISKKKCFLQLYLYFIAMSND